MKISKDEIGKFKFGSQEFRQFLRQRARNHISGRVYALIIGIYLLALISASAFQITNWSLKLVSLLPAYFLVFNFVEYILHRFPMHRPIPGMKVVYEHVTIHHNFFNENNEFFSEPEDARAAILPPYLVAGLSLLTTAIAFAIASFSTNDAGYLFAAASFSYYLIYEALHYSYHANNSQLNKCVPMLKHLANHHLLHHDTKLMSRWNFNITFPIFDIIFGTYFRSKKNEPDV